MPDGFSIDLETSPAIQLLDDARRSQIPFASAVALTRTAQAAQRAVKRDIPRRFETRSTFVERGVRIERATKRKQESAVQWRAPGGASRRSFAGLLAQHTTGAKRRLGRRYIARPVEVKRGKSGAIPKSRRPKRLLERRRVFMAPTRTARTFGIYERLGKKRYPIRMLYFLSDRPIDIQDSWDFRGVASTEAQRVYAREFGRAFAKAIASRRR